MGYDILFKWVAGHTNLPGNDLADKLAKNAAKSAQQNTATSSFSLTQANNISIQMETPFRIYSERSSSPAKTIDQKVQELQVTNSGIKTTQTNA